MLITYNIYNSNFSEINSTQKTYTPKVITVSLKKNTTIHNRQLIHTHIIANAVFTFCFTMLWLYGNSQQPVLSVQSFEYICKKDFLVTDVPQASLEINSPDYAIKDSIKACFARAVANRWNVTMPNFSLSVKNSSPFELTPKFKTKLKGKEAGKWYMFLQFFETSYGNIFYNSEDSLTTVFELRCMIINGANDSAIIDRDMQVSLYREKAPPDQIVLTNIPAYPASFIKAFDSIATWLFQQEVVTNKSLWLKPACVFTETERPDAPLMKLVFESDNISIQHITEPAFSFQKQATNYTKMGVKRNVGGNTVSGALTLLTGVGSSKTRVFKYNADLPFKEADSVYHCSIIYKEREVEDRTREKESYSDHTKSYSINNEDASIQERHTDSTILNTITLGNDTLATFRIRYIADEFHDYTRLWDGTDSTTIIDLPEDWKKKNQEDEVILSGRIGADAFSMKTSKEKALKEFYINELPALTVYGKYLPENALLFQQLSAQQLKLFTILSSLPYEYFNYSYN